MCKKCAKIANFGFYGLNYKKTVEDRWVYAARHLTGIEFSFDPCNIYRDGPRGVGYTADARSVGDSHPSCNFNSRSVATFLFYTRLLCDFISLLISI